MGETEKKTVKLYTRQNDKTLYQLERDGRVINQRAYVELHFGDIAPLFMESYCILGISRLFSWRVTTGSPGRPPNGFPSRRM